MVSAGLIPPLEGKKEPSTTWRLEIPWALLLGSRTLVRGSLPNRQVPQAWAIRSLFSACLIRKKTIGLQDRG